MTFLLTENILPNKKPLISESMEESGQKFYYLKGLFIEGELQNHNGRYYPRSEIIKAVNDINQKISEHGPILGELDHPEGIQINMDRVAVAITEMNVQQNNGFGTMRVIPAGLGLIVEGCIKAGVSLGVSSRGSGRVDGQGKVSEYDIITIDVVATPSAIHAFPKASLSEAAQSRYGNELLDMSKFIHDNKTCQKHIIGEFRKLFGEIQRNMK